MSNPLSQLTDPNLRSLLNAFRDELFYSLNCHQVGKIVSFDAATQSARVQIQIRRLVFNRDQPGQTLQLEPVIVDYPVLLDVPVFVPSGGGGVLTFPVAAGDTCLVCFNDRDVDNWFSTGTASTPNSPRAHSLSDGFALVGFRSKLNPVAPYSTTDAELKYLGGRIQVADKIGINNAATSLLTALDSLITALTSWVDTGGQTPNPATLANLTAAKALVDSLLK